MKLQEFVKGAVEQTLAGMKDGGLGNGGVNLVFKMKVGADFVVVNDNAPGIGYVDISIQTEGRF